jgi:hypothetical protein
MSEFGTNDASHELIPLYMYALTLPTKQTLKNALPGFASRQGRASPQGFAGLKKKPQGFAGLRLKASPQGFASRLRRARLRRARLRRASPGKAGAGFARFYHTPIFLDISKTPE